MHLYVMQNEHGFLKIGRSRTVEKRRAELEKTEACRILIVLIVEGAGDAEEALHLHMAEHRQIGEWFKGSDEAKAELVHALQWYNPVEWPFSFAWNRSAKDWLDILEERRAARSLHRELGRLALDMTRRPMSPENDPSRWRDTSIWTALRRFGDGVRTIVDSTRDEAGELVLTGYSSDRPGELVPHYTRDLDVAMTLWPESMRPDQWDGNAYDCCVAALLARRKQINLKR